MYPLNSFFTSPWCRASALAIFVVLNGGVAMADLIAPVTPKSGFEEEIQKANEAKALSREKIFKDPGLQQSREIRARMEAASSAYAAGNVAQAEKLIKDTAKDYPTDPSVEVSLARFYYSQKRFPEADTALQAALKMKESAYLYMDLGTLYAEGLNRPVEAVDYFYKAAALDAKIPGVHYALGQLLSKMGQVDQARKEFAEAAQLDPKNVLPTVGLARLEVQARQPQSALEAYGKALQIAPNSPALLIEVGDLYAATGKNAEALKSYTLATEKLPKDAYVWTKLGMFQQAQGKNIEADRAYEKALKLDSRSAVVLNNRAAIALESNSNLDQALRWSEEAVNLSPKNPYFLDTYGTILHRAKKLKEAKASLEKAINLEPKYPSARYHLALVDKDLGLGEDALNSLKVALTSDAAFPEREQAVALYQQLGGTPVAR